MNFNSTFLMLYFESKHLKYFYDMKLNTLRFKLAAKASSIHFGLSAVVAACIAFFVFSLWFPYPYRELAGGTELFMLVIAVDLVCGPLLTLVLYSPTKPKREMLTDMSLVVFIQILALCYGLWTVWLVRPIYLVQEADRLTIISRASIAINELDSLAAELKPRFFGGSIQVSLRDLTMAEREKLIAEIKAGGHDASEHPMLYVQYDEIAAYKNSRSLNDLIKIRPELKNQLENIGQKQNSSTAELRYLYIIGRIYAIAILNTKGVVIEYLFL